MTIPVILGTPTEGNTGDQASSDTVVILPNDIITGEMLVIVHTKSSNGTDTIPEGWDQTIFVSRSFNSRHYVYTKISFDGVEDSGLTVIINDTKSTRKSWVAFRTNANDIDVVASTSLVGTSINNPSVETTEPDVLLLRTFGVDTITANSSVTEFTPAGTLIAETVSNLITSVYTGVGYDTQASAGTSTSPASTSDQSTGLLASTVALFLGPKINDINGVTPVTDGATSVTFSYSGFASDPTSAKLLDSFGGEISLSSFSASGGTGTVDWQDVQEIISTSDTSGVSLTSSQAVITFQITNGSETATLDVTYITKPGFELVSVAAPVSNSLGSYFQGFTGTVLTDDQVYYNSASNTSISSTGIITSDLANNSLLEGVVYDQSDNTWKPHSVIFNPTEGGVIPGFDMMMHAVMSR